MAIDYRDLNSITIFHAEPVQSAEEDFYIFSGIRYFSELDLTKAYYYVPLSEKARPLMAFLTKEGLMEFCRLPFGLVTACATFIIVLAGLSHVSFILIIFLFLLLLGKIMLGFNLCSPAIKRI